MQHLLHRRHVLGASLASLLGASPLSALASESYPTKPVHLIIPFPAAGATDYAGRAIGNSLSQAWRQPVVFDNRSGAGSTIGTEAGAKSAPDGYTLVMGVPAGISIAPHIYPKLGYDPLQDLVPVAGFATSPMVVVVPANSPFKTFKDMVNAAKAQPGKLTFASNGSGSLPHLASAWFETQAKIELTHVPYRGSAQALPDLMAGRTDMMFDIIVSSLPLIESGRLRALAITSAQPSSRLPDVPTVASFGYPEFVADQWYGLFAPAHTPPAVVAKIEDDVRTACLDTKLRATMWQRGAEIRFSAAKLLTREVTRDHQRWKQVVALSGAKAE